ncbi:Alanine--tRNA ligase [Dissostichus eleginoides]|uniref:Alanine--tRNA ligase n=1 Tax=Dissostichus eleginoides TaxID=100907 RepID=A0AAD9CAJ4_DISEL|nr:Alanine--tRNA ligase [Dissostichus eleginoides]
MPDPDFDMCFLSVTVRALDQEASADGGQETLTGGLSLTLKAVTHSEAFKLLRDQLRLTVSHRQDNTSLQGI